MLFYQERFEKFIATFTGTPEEFYHSKNARMVLGFPRTLRKQRDRDLWQPYALEYARRYKPE